MVLIFGKNRKEIKRLPLMTINLNYRYQNIFYNDNNISFFSFCKEEQKNRLLHT